MSAEEQLFLLPQDLAINRLLSQERNFDFNVEIENKYKIGATFEISDL